MAPLRAVQEDIANRLLLSLPRTSLAKLRLALEFRSLTRGEVIAHADKPVEYLHFVNRGVISFVKSMQDGRSVEIGVTGIEGISSAHALFGINKAILDAVVQIPGTTFRIKRDKLRDIMARDATIRGTLEKYAHFSVAAFAQTAACNRLHHLDERCCRWLLIAHDSARSDTFQLTHEFLAMMLGVQRAGVSITASALQKAGLIEYRHGQVTITNRSGLEDTACECYRTMSGKFDELFPVQKKSSVREKPIVSAKGQPAFIARLNIEQYRQRLLTERDKATRERIGKLLAKEEAKLATLTNPPGGDKEKEVC